MAKLTTLLILISFMQISANSYSQTGKLDLKMKNVTLLEVFEEIEELSQYRFFYDNEQVDLTKKVTVKVEDREIADVLTEIFEGTDLTWKEKDRLILVRSKSNSSYVIPAKQGEVTGKVTDENGEPLPGVTIVIKGTTKGAVTNIDGNYTITDVTSGDILLFSFVGMLSQEIPVANQSKIDVAMKIDAIGIEEVVAVGYGTQKKVNLTGAISNVTAKELDARPITNMSNALSGLATGVYVSQSDGQPGRDEATIRIRGIGTLNDSNPLVLVDGIESSMSDINPNDVESISVLKDAASSAIYGSRAANGVILITSKKGAIGKLKVTYNGYYGIQSTTRKKDYLSDFATYMEMGNEAYANVGMAPIFAQSEIDLWKSSSDPIMTPNVDWVDVWLGDSAPVHSHFFSFAGGTEKTLYNFSLGYLDQEGITPDTWSKRYNFRMNWEGSILDNVKVGTNISGSWKDLEDLDWAEIFHQMPGIPYERHEDGRYGYAQALGAGTVNNPRAQWESREALERQTRFLGKIYLNWEIINGLKFSQNVAINYNNILNRTFQGQVDLWNFSENMIMRTLGDPESANNKNNEYFTITNYSTLNYAKTFSDDHNLNVLGGFSFEEYRKDQFGASIQEFHNNELQVLDAGLENPQVNGTASEWALMSYFGRVNYDYQGKYLFEANIRYDGSSRFKEGNKWGLFPSFSAGWRLSEEDFMSDIVWLDNLKLRASWGKLGNQNIGTYPYQTTYSLGQNYTMGEAVTSGIASTAVVNSDIKWETTTTTNIGVDATFFGKLNVTAEYFDRLTDGILVPMEIPKTMGDKTKPVVNLAEVRNNGWEFSTNYQDKVGDLGYSLGFNISNVNNEVTKYQGEVRSGGSFVTWEGYAFNSMYGYVCEGIIRTQEELDQLNAQAKELSGNDGAYYITNKTRPGDLKYKDLDGNGVIDSNDREIIGNTIPKYTYGISLGLNYKGFDFSALLQGVQGRDSYLEGVGIFPMGINGDRGQIPMEWVTDRYIPEDPSTWETATLPRIVNIGSHNQNYKFSTSWKQDASFLRVKSVQLGYNIPNTKSFGFEKIRVFFSGENLLTFTKFEGYDPERSQTATDITRYPLQKTVTFGAQISF
ncbi:TonB-dependent receptor [Prolixibacteraceae bacterium Z1-6]|uniref:TonB-dependent receptor n=1 Tax=Draconibacterium aestuarii TaxID=2998507 RepID=A0A9X3J682_9BACT|nr:TonB-dependent receptor [Prolixibacteraceae bacterium Z1-6]